MVNEISQQKTSSNENTLESFRICINNAILYHEPVFLRKYAYVSIKIHGKTKEKNEYSSIPVCSSFFCIYHLRMQI